MKILDKILKARENRAFMRLEMANKAYNSLSFSLNIAGYPKSNQAINSTFEEIIKELEVYLLAHRVKTISKEKKRITDQAGDFYLIALNSDNVELSEIKKLSENFETKHVLSRLIDIDIFSRSGEPISSGKEKRCYFCEKHSAVSCMRNKRHSYKEIREKIFIDIENYLQEKKKNSIIQILSELALKAILYEVSLSPKPGLVDYFDSGSHKDMNFYSFINSSAALSPFFKDFCLLGYNYTGNYENVLPKIREIGILTEKAMFKSSGGINTQKGIIFLFGISLFAASNLFAKSSKFSEKKFSQIVKRISRNIVEKELKKIKKIKSNGEIVYAKYGTLAGGIRNEVASGFETIFVSAIPFLHEKHTSKRLLNQKELTQILQKTLLKIMSINNDTNILYRSDLETLNEIKKLSIKILQEEENYNKLSDFCKEKNISPGGSADLLAVSLFIYFCELL